MMTGDDTYDKTWGEFWKEANVISGERPPTGTGTPERTAIYTEALNRLSQYQLDAMFKDGIPPYLAAAVKAMDRWWT